MSALYPSFSECPLNEVFAKRNLPYHNLIAHVCIGENMSTCFTIIHFCIYTEYSHSRVDAPTQPSEHAYENKTDNQTKNRTEST